MRPDEIIARGRQAAFLLENPTFREALDSCLVHCQMQWANSGLAQNEERERFYFQFRAIHDVEEMLKNFVEHGSRTEKEQHGDG